MNIRQIILTLYKTYKYAGYYDKKLIHVMALLPIIILISRLINR